jgi:hypothetical protein
MAVLDSNFKVRAADGLRVVDASVFPAIPGIFIAVPVYMVSEFPEQSFLFSSKFVSLKPISRLKGGLQRKDLSRTR